MQVIGIDVAKATFYIALPLWQGKYRTRAKVGNELGTTVGRTWQAAQALPPHAKAPAHR